MNMASKRKRRSAPFGFSMIELMFVMSILAGSFVAILAVLNFIGSGMYFETSNSDQTTRTTGTLYDIVSEVRDATAYSPNFYIEVNPAMPPCIVFDKIDSVDAEGNIVWGSKVTYRLEKATDSASLQFQADHPGIVPGCIVRQENFTQANQAPAISHVEERVPYQFTQNGTVTWGFNVIRNGYALSVVSSHFGDAKIDTHAPSGTVQNLQVQATAPLSSTTQGSIVISTATGTYFLRNPKIVIPAE